jgi:ABC-type uncharacterized transport system involved in gliding motility auxiliary subunit
MSDQTTPPPSGRSATGRIAVIAAVLGAIIFVCVNIISAHVFSSDRLDLTQQHLYSLSQGTKTLLGELREPVRFRMFMSSGLTKQAPQLAAFATRVRSLLDAYVAAAKGNIVLEVIDPRPFSEDEDRAVAFGIDGFQGTGGERLFFGLAATNSTTGRATIGVFTPDREAFLEYDLTRLVSELGRRGKPVVALLDGIGLAGNPMARIPEQQVLVQMKQFFDVKPIEGDVDKLPDQTRVLMVVHPQNLSQKTLYTIDQWVMAGNPTMVFVDPYAENQMGPRGGPPPNPTSTLEPLFKSWGVTFDTTRAIGDPPHHGAEPAMDRAARRRAGARRSDPGAAVRRRDDDRGLFRDHEGGRDAASPDHRVERRRHPRRGARRRPYRRSAPAHGRPQEEPEAAGAGGAAYRDTR